MRRTGAVLAAMAVTGLTLTGCSFSIGSGGPPVVAKADLQKEISQRLEKAGQKPQSVDCKDDLTGVVGKSVTCEVALSDTNVFEPVVTVTKVDGSTVSYDMAPAVSKEQLQKAVQAAVAVLGHDRRLGQLRVGPGGQDGCRSALRRHRGRRHAQAHRRRHQGRRPADELHGDPGADQASGRKFTSRSAAGPAGAAARLRGLHNRSAGHARVAPSTAPWSPANRPRSSHSRSTASTVTGSTSTTRPRPDGVTLA